MALTIGSLVGLIQADDSGMRRGLTTAELRMRGFQRDTEGRLRRLNGQFATSGDLMAAGLATGTAEGNKFNLSLGRIAGMAGSFGGVVGSIGGIVAALGAAVPLAAGLVATLVQIAPAAGVAATGIVAVQLASYALKIGMSGVGDAVSAALDPSKAAEFEKALAKLSPNARAFALEVKGLSKEFDALKKDVQDRLFAGLDKTLRGMAEHTLPTLRTGLASSAGALNLMARNVGNAAIGLGKSGTLGSAISSANAGLFNLSRIPAQIVTGLVQVAAAAGPSFARLTGAAGTAFDGISQKISDAFESGRMQEAIETAIDLIGDLADVAGNIGSILGSVFSAAQASGGGFVGTLQEITGSLADAFASPAVQDGLKALFQTMATLAQTAAPLLGQALGLIAPVLVQLGPPAQALIKTLGSALSPIIEALGPILVAAASAVGSLVEAFLPFLPVLSSLIVTALKPLKPIIEQIGKIFVELAPQLAKIAELFGPMLTPIIAGLAEVAVQFVEQFGTQLIAMLPQVMELVIGLAPVFLQLAESLGEILLELAPLIPQIMLLATTLLMSVLPAILPLIPPLAQLAVLLLRIATAVITGVVIPALTGLIRFFQGMQAALQPAVAAVSWLVKSIVGLFQWLYDVLVGHSIIPDMINAIVRAFAGLPGRAMSALSSLGGRISSLASSAMRSMGSAISRGLSSAVSAIRGLPGRARSALGGIGGVLAGAGRSLIQGFINGLRSKFGDVKSTLGGLTSSLTSWKGPEDVDRTILTPAGELVIGGFMRGIDNMTPGLRTQLQGLTSEVPGMAVGGLGAAPNSGGGVAVVRIELDGPEPLKRLIRKIVKDDGGGSVQAAFGDRRVA